MTKAHPTRTRAAWFFAFLREQIGMPRRHIMVFLVTTLVFVLLEVEMTKGWHLIPILEVAGGMLLLYLLWAAWRSASVD